MTSIRTNYTSLSAQTQQEKTMKALGQAIERLSSGSRINSAKDDAAGMAISNRMTAMINGQAQARRNTNDGVSMAQTVQRGLSEVNNRLQRVRELTVQGLSEGISMVDADAVQGEINLNLKEINRLTEQSSFNGYKVLDGSAGKVNLQVGTNDNQTLGLNLGKPGFTVDELGLTDLVVRGIKGAVTSVNQLQGDAFNILLDDAVNTTVTYSSTYPGFTSYPAGSNPNFVISYAGTGAQIGYFTQITDTNGKPTYYESTGNPHYDTATGKSTVPIFPTSYVATSFFTTVNTIPSRAFGADIAYLKSDGTPAAGTPTLVQAIGGSYMIKNGADYYEAT